MFKKSIALFLAVAALFVFSACQANTATPEQSTITVEEVVFLGTNEPSFKLLGTDGEPLADYRDTNSLFVNAKHLSTSIPSGLETVANADGNTALADGETFWITIKVDDVKYKVPVSNGLVFTVTEIDSEYILIPDESWKV